jgi:Ca2+-dependent lipid-binding protein
MPQNTTVYVRVGEGKDLPAKDITGSSDPFCTIRVDNEEVARYGFGDFAC